MDHGNTTDLKMARLSDQSTSGRRRFILGRSLMKCCPPNTSAAYRPQNMKDLLLVGGNTRDEALISTTEQA